MAQSWPSRTLGPSLCLTHLVYRPLPLTVCEPPNDVLHPAVVSDSLQEAENPKTLNTVE